MSLGDWLDERTGWRGWVRAALDEPVPGGARPAYVFGSCLVVVLILQAATGVAMATCYSPSVSAAWASVVYLQDRLTLGWFVRGLHSAGASAMVILLVLHLLQTALSGAYRRPREVTWIVGVLLLALTFGFALTGYLLPWDQKGYWATQVATGLAGAVPLVGRGLLKLLQGGDTYGNLTLTRFYALHVFVLPAAVAFLVVIHVALFRRHGVTPGWRITDAEVTARAEPFWPRQVFYDAVAVALVVGMTALGVIATHGAGLEAPADPASSYDARPEWYFLPLFQLLKLFPGRLEIVVALGAPLGVFGLLIAVPFLDGRERGRTRPAARLRSLAPVAVLLVGALVLGAEAKREDAASPTYRAARQRAVEEARRARSLAAVGVGVAGGTVVWENDPAVRGRRIFAERCAGCHRLGGIGENRAPTLDGWSSRDYLAAFLVDPENARFYGKTKVRGMKPVRAPESELRALVEFVYAMGGDGPIDEALRRWGEALFRAKECDYCHETDGATAGHGPNLGRRGSPGWLRDFLGDPGAPRFFGKKNEMPKFGDKLSDDETDALIRLLVDERRK